LYAISAANPVNNYFPEKELIRNQSQSLDKKSESAKFLTIMQAVNQMVEATMR